MNNPRKPTFHYPANVSMSNSPLVEAWLTIQWELQRNDPSTPVGFDPGYSTALLGFSSSVKERFDQAYALEVNQIPEQLTPHQPRYQFRRSQDSWSVVQLGPGVATVNFVNLYSWESFRETVDWIRPKLLDAYRNHKFQTSLLSLKFQNAIPFRYSENDLVSYLKESLNTDIKLPRWIPGEASANDNPAILDLNFAFKLSYPRGRGTLRIVTGTKKDPNQYPGTLVDTEHILFELEVISAEGDAPELANQVEFDIWLESAHDVIHDWFLSLIDGPLAKQVGLQIGR